MIQTTIQIQGLNQLNGFLTRLPTKLVDEISKESEQFMKDVRKSAKLRAPRDTRELANSIVIYNQGKNNWVLEVQSPYGKYQEEGFTPHWIHTDMITGSNKFSQIYGGKSGFIFVSKSTPFVKPAFEHNISKLSQRISKSTKDAINKSRGNR